MNALIDTGLLLDYLNGDVRAADALARCKLRSISAITWLEVMSNCPRALHEPTRGFLRSFERLSASESIADEALRLMLERPSLSISRAMTWASANINQLSFITTDGRHITPNDKNVVVAYVVAPTPV